MRFWKLNSALKTARELFAYSLHAADGVLGKIKDLYFDDLEWRVRYLVVDSGRWLFGRRVLVSPVCAGSLDTVRRSLLISMTRSMVEKAPAAPAHKRFSRAQERALAEYYGWPLYWRTADRDHEAGDPSSPSAAALQEETCDSHLRSVKAVARYRVLAEGQEIGQVEDFFVEPDAWAVRHLILASSDRAPRQKTVIPVGAVRHVDCEARRLDLAVTARTARTCPPVYPSLPVSRQFELRLCDHFGCSPYWLGPRQAAERASGT